MKISSRLVDLLPDEGSATTDSDVSPGQAGLGNPGLLRRFVELVEAAADDRYRHQFDDAELLNQLTETFQFVSQRRRKQTNVRIFSCPSPEGNGSECNTVLEVLLSDHPFIVDTIRLCLDFTGLRTVSALYLTLPSRRDRSGRLIEFDGHKDPEMIARFEIAGDLQDDFRQSLERAVRERLEISATVTRDFRRMKTCLRAAAKTYKQLQSLAPREVVDVIADARAMIDWLLDDYFILMGVSFYPADGSAVPTPVPERELGYTRVPYEERALCGEKILTMAQGKLRLEEWVTAFKSQEESLIHRSGKIDNFLLRSYNESGEYDGTYHLRGLFTFKAIRTLGSQIPLVRLKLAELVQTAGLREGSLSWKSYTNAFDSIPVEFLFEAPSREIATIVDTILYVEKSKELRSHVAVDRENRKALYFLALPRHGYSEQLRRRIEQVLIEGLGATYSDSRVYFGKFETILLTFFFTAADSFLPYNREELDERVRAVAGTWEERFFRELTSRAGRGRGQFLWDRYHRAFSEEYQLQHSAEECVRDVDHLERFAADPQRSYSLEVFASDEDRKQRCVRLRLYQRRNLYLSTILPVLDNFGLQVVDQSHFRVQPANCSDVFVDSFRIAGFDGDQHPLLTRKEVVLGALETVFNKWVASDHLNRLTVQVGLEWRDVDLLRAYLHYLRQLGEGSTFLAMGNALRQHVGITRKLMELYRVRFDPELELPAAERETQCGELQEAIQDELHDVPSSAQDTLFRLLLNLFTSTLRTNRYKVRPPSEHYLAFKVDSGALTKCSEPRPWREIYVYHNQMEGIHLRGGNLARGGIRWSDRLSDYRDEVLGLMRTQMVKNVLIVPVGAKGGFVVRRPHSDRERRRAQGEAMYRIFIHGLLDLTDNVLERGVLPPEGVVRYDEEDPYLVVAADKGTASFSDIANEISLERGFWLGDAFASGGSQGYDHKALGVTARGAWEGVLRHFREMELDPETDEFTAVGIGDMSGDVFGNGMLLSRRLCLVAAFNHQHIFIDPNPDAEASFSERQRLFGLPGSSWDDYDEAKLSPGGGIYSRQAKMIQVTPEAQERLGLTASECTPDELIQAVLCARVDLLWNGGIGTYVKASTEDNRDVGDLSNQSVRVSATKVRARVIGEGGNLGFTQAGRVEYCLRGGRMNTDFVDNSAGVDCSDHEVNLKILLQAEIALGRLVVEERNELLERLADSVCKAVLRNNRNQGLLLSLDEIRSRRDPFSFERTIKALEDLDLVDRTRDQLPQLETLLNRHEQGQGMTRAELAHLSAYAKMSVYQKLLALPEDSIAGLDDYLRVYFPREVVRRFPEALPQHLLGREIGLTMITNMIIDYAGAVFFFDVESETGASCDRIVHAYQLADELYETRALRTQVLEHEGTVGAAASYESIRQIEDAIHRTVVWLLNTDEEDRLERITQERTQFNRLLRTYEDRLASLLTKTEAKRYQTNVESFVEAGFSDELAGRLASFEYITAGLGIASISHDTGTDLEDVMSLYFQVGHSSFLVRFIRNVDERSFAGRWESLALRILRNSMLESLGALTTRQVLGLGPGSGEEWVARGVQAIDDDPRVISLRNDMQKLTREELSIAAIQVISERLRRVFE